jgi:DNA-binding MarR family transcriptional regulator
MTKLKTFALIERISSLLRSEQRKRYATLGLQPVHVQAMEYLDQCNRFNNTPRSLTKYLGLTKGTLSQTLKVLVRKGYIEKQTDAEDGRVVRLKLLESGKQLLDDIQPPDAFEQAEQTVSKSSFVSFNEALIVTLTELQRASNSSSFGLCNTCALFTEQDNHYFCNSRQESMTQDDAAKICRDHTLM